MSSGKTLPQFHIINLPPPRPPFSHTNGRKLGERSDLSKVLPTRAYFGQRPFCDFGAFLNYKNFNTVLCLEGSDPQFALYLLTFTNPF